MINKNFNVLDMLSVVALIVGIYSFVVAIQNLDENRIQTEDTKQVLHKLNVHLLNKINIWLSKINYY